MFDAGTLARGWLAVSLASGSDEATPIIDRTLLVESYHDGVRLAATDRYMVLSAWIPAAGVEAERSLDEAPSESVVVRDPDGRGRALLAYLRKLAAKAAKDEIPLPQVALYLNEPVEEGTEAGFPGMELRQVVIDYPDHEKLALPIVQGEYPAYRSLLLGHTSIATRNVAIAGEFMARLGQIGKILGSHVRCSFAGDTGMVGVEVENALVPPYIRGGVMPVKQAEIEAVA